MARYGTNKTPFLKVTTCSARSLWIVKVAAEKILTNLCNVQVWNL